MTVKATCKTPNGNVWSFEVTGPQEVCKSICEGVQRSLEYK